MSEAEVLSLTDLGIAALLVVVAGVVSLSLRLQLERRLGIAALRTVVQLLLVGYVLEWVFAARHVVAILAVVAIMTIAAARAAVRASKRTFVGAWLQSFLTLALTGMVTTVTVTRLIIGIEPWYTPQYFIVLLGMVFGNTLTGVSLCLDHMLESLSKERAVVETELALGATAWEASRTPLVGAVRRGMIPITNSMMVVGLVSLPGMMTGQILQGASPINAVKYQIVVMFMIAAATSLACVMTGLLVFRRMFNARHQLMSERIIDR